MPTAVVATPTVTGTTSKYFAPKQPRAPPPVTAGMNRHTSTVNAQLVPISALPSEFTAAYSFSHLNRLQSACFADLFFSDVNLVISAPTASGKTMLMEIAMCPV
ncbi:ATP-dependent DNA helicase MER3 [Coemansia spiralis]|uniref:ATP-dependent DNA helicase MER3 n=1 Tax=Coemansia spiralis TaxID=417178 RepID=A0A9W8L1X1_9FUNG|nr:ATP-dependent DNA helicase MER3 [Coemansia spiralis]